MKVFHCEHLFSFGFLELSFLKVCTNLYFQPVREIDYENMGFCFFFNQPVLDHGL